MLTKSLASSKLPQSKIRFFQNKFLLRLSSTVPGGTWREHSPVLHSYLLLLLDTNFYRNKVSPTRVEMCSFFHLLWNYHVLSTEPFLPVELMHALPTNPQLELLKDFKNRRSFLQTSLNYKARRKTTKKRPAYFCPFRCEGRCPFGIIFRTVFRRRWLAPINSRFVLWRVGNKIRIGLRDIFGQVHVDQGFRQWPYSPQSTRSLHKAPSIHSPLVTTTWSAPRCSCSNNGMVFELVASFVENCSTDHFGFNFLYHRLRVISYWSLLERQRTVCQTGFILSVFTLISFPIQMKGVFRGLTGWRGTVEKACKLPSLVFFWGIIVFLLREVICKEEEGCQGACLQRIPKATRQWQCIDELLYGQTFDLLIRCNSFALGNAHDPILQHIKCAFTCVCRRRCMCLN